MGNKLRSRQIEDPTSLSMPMLCFYDPALIADFLHCGSSQRLPTILPSEFFESRDCSKTAKGELQPSLWLLVECAIDKPLSISWRCWISSIFGILKWPPGCLPSQHSFPSSASLSLVHFYLRPLTCCQFQKLWNKFRPKHSLVERSGEKWCKISGLHALVCRWMDLTLNASKNYRIFWTCGIPMDNRSQRVGCIVSVPLDHEKSEFPEIDVVMMGIAGSSGGCDSEKCQKSAIRLWSYIFVSDIRYPLVCATMYVLICVGKLS